MRKILATVLATSMLLLGGCGSTSESSDKIQVNYWHSMDGVFGEVVEKQIEAFNNTIGEEKGIHVTGVFQNWPGTDSLTAAMTTDDISNMPDVIQLYGESVSLVRDYDRTVWAEEYITQADSSLSKGDLVPNTVSAYSIGDEMIGVPYTASSLMLYYNETYLTESGYEAAPTTIAEMAEMMPVIVESTDAEYGLNVRVNLYELENFIITQGAEGSYLGNNESGHADYMTDLAMDENGTLMNFLTEWEKVTSTGVFKETRDSINEEFAAGMHAMVIMSSSRIQTIDELVGDEFDWSVTSIPTVSADDLGGSYPSGAGLFMIDRDDQERVDAAWEFTAFMASAEAQAMWLDGTGYTPVNVNVMELDAYADAIAAEPKLELATNNLLGTPAHVVSSFLPNSSTIDGIIKDNMILLGSGEISVQEAYDNIVNGSKDAINEYYSVNPIQ